MAKKTKTKQETGVSMRLSRDTHKILKNLAQRKNTTVSNVIRQMIDKCLAKEEYREDLDDISSYLIQQIEKYLEPQVNRIIKCVIKGSITSSAGYFLNAKAIEEFIPPHRQEEFIDSLRETRDLGIRYIRSGNKSLDQFMEEDIY